MTETSIVEQGYDAVYEAMPRSPTLLRIWKEKVVGDDYPDDFYHISFLTLPDLRQLGDALALGKGSRFCDVACGMGGPALWLAQDREASLWGVDFSKVAITQAEKRAVTLGLTGSARFSVGSFADTGLESASMDAAMSVDALQYAPNKRAAIQEFARIIRPGGRLAFTAFEVRADRAAGLPVIGENPLEDYRELLGDGDFRVLSYEQTPAWHERLAGAYRAVIDAEEAIKSEMGPLATAALMSEVTLTLGRDLYSGRVFAVAEKKA